MLMPYRVEPYAGGVNVTVGQTTMFFGDVTEEQMHDGKTAYKEGALIQRAFPFLSDDEREFLMSGLTPDMWDDLFTEK